MTSRSRNTSGKGTPTLARTAVGSAALETNGYIGLIVLTFGDEETRASGMTKIMQTLTVFPVTKDLVATHMTFGNGNRGNLVISGIENSKNEQERSKGGRKVKKTRSGKCTKKK